MDFNYQKDHSRAFYAEQTQGPIKRGMLFWCHSKEDEVEARKQGYTTDRYVQSDWPKTVWNKLGQSKPVGKIEWTDEQNAAALQHAIDNGFGVDHVPVPDVKDEAPRPEASLADISILAVALADIKMLQRNADDSTDTQNKIGDALVAINSRLDSIDARLSELEGADAPAPKAKKA